MHTYFQAISNPWKRDLNLWQFDTSYVVTGAHHGGLTWKLHISDPLCKETTVTDAQFWYILCY